MTPGKSPTNPMKEGHPEPFPEPRTIPTGWDMSEFLDDASDPEREASHRETDPDEDWGDFPTRL
jgi:hypothetical protein